MNPELPPNPRAELEARLTAYLLGELSAHEAAALRQALDDDAELAKMCERLKPTIKLVYESAKTTPSSATSAEPLKLSDDRRQKLLAHFKTIAPKEFAAPPARQKINWLVQLAAAAVITLVLAGLLLPSLAKSKSKAVKMSVYSNLRQIDLAKRIWASDNNKSTDDIPTFKDLKQYLGDHENGAPPSIAGETYVLGKVGEPAAAEVDARKAAKVFGRSVKTEAHGGHVRLYADGNLALMDDSLTRHETPPPPAPTVAAAPPMPTPLSGSRVPLASAQDTERPHAGWVTDSLHTGVLPAQDAETTKLPRGVPVPSANTTIVLPNIADNSTENAGMMNNNFPANNNRNDAGVELLNAGALPPPAFANNSLTEKDKTGLTFGLQPNDVVTSTNAIGFGGGGGGGGIAGIGGVGHLFRDRLSEQPQSVFNSGQLAADKPISPPVVDAVTGLPIAGADQNGSVTTFGGSNAGGVLTENEKGRFLLAQGNRQLTAGAATEGLRDRGIPMEDNFSTSKLGVANSPNSSPKVDGVAPGSVTFTFDSGARSTIAMTDNADTSNLNYAYQSKQQELQGLIKYREALSLKTFQEGVETRMPKTTMVPMIEHAEADQAPPRTFGERVAGIFSDKVERRARIKVEKDVTDVAGLAGKASTPVVYDPQFVQTTFEAIQSDAVLDQVIEKLDLTKAWANNGAGVNLLDQSKTRALLKKSLDLRAVPNSSMVDIGVKSANPEEAARIANAVAEAYHDYSQQDRRQAGMAAIKDTDKQIAELDLKVARAKEEMAAVKKQLESQLADAPLPKPTAPIPVPQPEVLTSENAFSTFSLNVADVSFKLAAASLEKGVLPDPASIRSEEFINAFDYRDPDPAPGAPLGFAWERAHYPFAHNRDLLRFSVKTAAAGRPAGRALNLVLLLDNSGSMERADRVQIIHEALRVLASQLQPQDKLSIVTFARTPHLWVDGVAGSEAGAVVEKVGSLTPQGGTNLEDAMRLAYETARRHYLAEGINRVVLLTDGAANLGNVDPAALKQKVEENRRQGIALDCFGIGWEGYNDDLLEALSRNGDGRYGFLNTPAEAANDFAGELAGALNVAAADVKVQVEFNPKRVNSYRQIGYAKHQLTKEQFRDNSVDAAEIGAAESGNALYTVEINPSGEGPVATVHVRFKVPGTTDYREHAWEVPYTGNGVSLEQASPALRLAATASAFSEWLATSPYAAEVTPDQLLGYLAGVPKIYGADARPAKLEWMIRQAKSISGK